MVLILILHAFDIAVERARKMCLEFLNVLVRPRGVVAGGGRDVGYHPMIEPIQSLLTMGIN